MEYFEFAIKEPSYFDDEQLPLNSNLSNFVTIAKNLAFEKPGQLLKD
jgi:hypothetical protein